MYDTILEKMKAVSNYFMAGLLIGLTLLLGASIGMRYFLGQPISWANAVARYTYIYIVFVGSAIAYMEDQHASIDALHSIMPSGLQKVFDLLHYLIIMGLSVLLIIWGIKHAVNMWPVHSPVLSSFPMGIVYLSIPVSFLIIFLFLLRHIACQAGY